MKKLLAVVMAVAIVLSLGVTSFAATAVFDPAADVLDGDLVVGMDPTDNSLPAISPAPNVPFNESWVLYDNGKNIDAGEVAQPDQTLYFAIGDNASIGEALFDKDIAKVKFDKGDENAKMISSMSLAEKKLDGFNTGNRFYFTKIVLKNDMTDKEFKLNPSITFTTKVWVEFDPAGSTITRTSKDTPADTEANHKWAKPGTKLTFNLKFFSGNWNDTADKDYAAGKGGVMLKPQKNEDNEITWEDEIGTLARLTFVGDSSVNKIFPKLSTKWENSDYAEFFADQDAFLFDFVGNLGNATNISSTSRATLELYNPYYDADEDELTVDPEDVIIYQVDVDGTFTDVTASFKATENDDGDSVFTTKTRELGTYIFAEKVAGTVVDEEVETPDDGKVIPNTGR